MWMQFIAAENEEVLEMLAEESPVMEKAVKKLVYVSADELVRYEMEMREKAELDYRSAMHSALDEGLQQGLQKGEMEKAYRTAERALKRGGNPEDIAYDLELPLDTVLQLKEKFLSI